MVPGYDTIVAPAGEECDRLPTSDAVRITLRPGDVYGLKGPARLLGGHGLCDTSKYIYHYRIKSPSANDWRIRKRCMFFSFFQVSVGLLCGAIIAIQVSKSVWKLKRQETKQTLVFLSGGTSGPMKLCL